MIFYNKHMNKLLDKQSSDLWRRGAHVMVGGDMLALKKVRQIVYYLQQCSTMVFYKVCKVIAGDW